MAHLSPPADDSHVQIVVPNIGPRSLICKTAPVSRSPYDTAAARRCQDKRVVRRLGDEEIAALLTGDLVARLSTIDADGYPHVTPLWFVWDDGRFLLASDTGRPHVHRIRENPRVGLVIDVEDPERSDGERPNRQVRAIGDATLSPDKGGEGSRRIWAKYRHGEGEPGATDRLRGLPTDSHRHPHHVVAVASV